MIVYSFDNKKVLDKYAILNEKIAKSGNRSKNFEIEVKIYRSEIHIISVIGDNDDIHISEIARKFGVTRGCLIINVSLEISPSRGISYLLD